MTTKALIAALVLCICALAGEGYIYHSTHPKYSTATFENDRLSMEYPAAWNKPIYSISKDRKSEGLGLGTWGDRVPDFDTRWDTYKNLDLDIDFRPPEAFTGADAREALTAQFQAQHKRSFGADRQIPPTLAPVKISGLDGWAVTEPHHYEMLDIVFLDRRPPFHPIKALYELVFGGTDTDHTILIRTKKGWCKIEYFVPGDKIARARYERIYGRILDSLKIKDA